MSPEYSGDTWAEVGVGLQLKIWRRFWLLGLGAFVPHFGVAQDPVACQELLRFADPVPALRETLDQMRLWDVMPGVGGDWVALPSTVGMRMIWVSSAQFQKAEGARIPLPISSGFTVPWPKLGFKDPSLGFLRAATGHFVEAAEGFLVDIQNSPLAEEGSTFHWIGVAEREARPVSAALKKISRGAWRYVGEDLLSGDVFFAKVTHTARSGQWLVRASLRGSPTNWKFQATDLRAFFPQSSFKKPFSARDLVGVHVLQGGHLIVFAIRGSGLWVVDTQSQSLRAQYTEAQLAADLHSAGLPADRIRFFWDRLHVGRDGASIGWGVSRILKQENPYHRQVKYQMDVPIAFRWSPEEGQSPQFAALHSDVASADVYDWVFSDIDDSMTLFGNQIVRDSEMRAVVWRWSFKQPASQAVSVLRVGEGVTPYPFNGPEMEARLQREIMQDGWVLAADGHAFGPQGQFVSLPVRPPILGRVGSWSVFEPGFYQIEYNGDVGGGLWWIPFSRSR